MRGCDLQGKRVVTEDGTRIGRVAEIHTANGEVTALIVGRGAWLQRFWTTERGRRIPWDQVRQVGDREIVVA
jgi:sporulation protein YlmC with PRC-barrel domain